MPCSLLDISDTARSMVISPELNLGPWHLSFSTIVPYRNDAALSLTFTCIVEWFDGINFLDDELVV